jgi:RHS repeat-associated protein
MLSQAADGNNRIVGFCYDAVGNLLAQSAPPCPSPTYAYNAENQMSSTAGVTYTYDGDGHRVKKSNGTLYWYGMGSDALDETDLSGNLRNEYIFFGGKRIARRDASGNVDCYFADHLGTSRVVANASGSILDDSDFYPFGGERVVASSSGNHYKFTGKERDGTGLDNFGARYNSSSLGRFMSPDEPLIDQDTGRPQSWNLYSYVRNNPLNSIDPNGHDCVYLNDSGNGVESIDHNSNSGECNEHGGRWANGTVENASWVQTDPNSDTVHIFSHYKDVLGQTWAGPGWSHGDKYADMISPEKIEEVEDRQILLWAVVSITLPHFGAGFTEIEDVTQPGSRFPSIRVNLTPEEFGENLEATGYTKGITKGGATTYTKGDKQYTLYTASSTRGPSAQVKVSGEVVSKIRLQ